MKMSSKSNIKDAVWCGVRTMQKNQHQKYSIDPRGKTGQKENYFYIISAHVCPSD